jgi:selenocysteine lyase/cysteine desulfurase
VDSLARRCFSNALQSGDEVVLASENHTANVAPWLDLANRAGAQVKWWTVTDKKCSTSKDTPIMESSVLSDLITPMTKIVAVSHSSNIIGAVRDITTICQLVHERTENRAQVIVDGVAASPHMLSSDVFEGNQSMQPDWYVVSLHKMFGPHLGCLIGKNDSLHRLVGQESTHKLLEMGTINIEACAGAISLSTYFKYVGKQAIKQAGKTKTDDECMMKSAKNAIQSVEAILVDHLLFTLSQSSPLIRIIQDQGHQRIKHYTDKISSKREFKRLPFVSFTHANIDSNKIVDHCRSNKVVCRACKFLSTDRFWSEMGIRNDGVVRFSLAHYNSIDEIDRAVDVLKTMDNWAMDNWV